MKTFKHVPQGLKRRRIWLLWRMEHGDKKVPYYANGQKRNGTLDSPEDRKELTTFDDALTALNVRRGRPNAFTGLGVALGDDGDGKIISGIDLDDCIDNAKGGKLSALANEVLTASKNTYCEISPSRQGLKVFGVGNIGHFTDHKIGLEIYSEKRFFTVTGMAYCSDCKKLMNLKDAAYVARTRSSKAEEASTPGVTATTLPSVGIRVTEGGRNTFLSKEAYRLKKEGLGQEAIRAILHAMNDAACDPKLEASEVEAIVSGKKKVDAEERSTVHRLENFYAYNPTGRYICLLDYKMWVPKTIDSTLPGVVLPGMDKPMKASVFLDQKRAVQSVIWAPGLPQIIEGKLPMPDGLGWRDSRDARCFNNYVPPKPMKGNPKKIGPWLAHLERMYPDDVEHVCNWLAHRVQKPGEKINHALVLGGSPGIGKDTILWPLRLAIGESNWQDITPRHIFHDFNAFVKSVVLNIGEARDLGDSNRFAFYEHMKPLLASPPDAFLCNEKFIPAYVVANVCGVVITTNHLIGGMYLPADDRRHYVAWCAAHSGDEGYTEDVFTKLWDWYNTKGGAVNVATFLAERDLRKFNAKAAPAKTAAFYQMVDSHRPPEDPLVLSLLEKLKMPKCLTVRMLIAAGRPLGDNDAKRLNALASGRSINHVLQDLGYERVANPNSQQRLWLVAGSRAIVYINTAKVKPEDAVKTVEKFAREWKEDAED